MKNPAVVAGVGMVPFAKPGASAPYYDMGAEAARRALADAGLDYDKVQQAYVGYVYGDSTCGQRALYPVGMTGIPVVNVNNNCSTGSTALFLARQAVASGAADCVIALGFEQMKPGALGSYFDDRPTPFEAFDQVCNELVGHPDTPMAIRYFGGAGMPDVFAHGMLSMAYLGRFLARWAPQTHLRHFSVRFAAITPIGAKADLHRQDCRTHRARR
jgi:acetyl-CoA acetyltransferase